MKTATASLLTVLLYHNAAGVVGLPSHLQLPANGNVGWTRGNEPARFRGKSLKELQGMFPRISHPTDAPAVVRTAASRNGVELPEYFDWRSVNGTEICKMPLRSQGLCAACYVFGPVETVSHRLCLAGVHPVKAHLSVQNILNCDMSPSSKGCQQGHPGPVYTFMKRENVVSEICQPFASAHVSAGMGTGKQTCVRMGCTNTTMAGKREIGFVLKSTKFVTGTNEAATPAGLEAAIKKIQTEIYKWGPVTGAFTVYRDLFYYNGGVYKHDEEAEWATSVGGHTVKIVGWGPGYWILGNTWGAWGVENSGYFYYAWGQGIENSVLSGVPIIQAGDRTRQVYIKY